MAKNFLEQALSLIGLKSPNTTDYYDPSVYKAEVSINEVSGKLSNVEKYQQQKSVSVSEKKELTGVEKYLKVKQQPEQEEKITTEDTAVKKLTGVAKYLSTKQQVEQEALANMTGVAKYLYKLRTHKKTPPRKAAPDKIEASVKLSRVDMYLARQQEPALKKQAVTVSQKMPEEEPKIAPEIKEAIKIPAKIENSTPTPAKTNEIIDHTEGATQCQAATLKRTQCSRKKNLETIERTVNNQQYKFAVCSQHNIDSFTPFGAFLQEGSI